MSRNLNILAVASTLLPAPAAAQTNGAPHNVASPIVIGESFTIDSRALGEVRRINVFLPTVYGEPPAGPIPVLYMPDGGVAEDFLHVAGGGEVAL